MGWKIVFHPIFILFLIDLGVFLLKKFCGNMESS